MAQPGSYFTDRKARELAELVWSLAEQRMAQGTLASAASEPVLRLHTTYDAKRCVYASDWITDQRGDGEEAGMEAVNAAFGKPASYFDPTTIGDVEHFYRAAFLSIGVTPFISAAGIAGWDLAFDPILKEPIKQAILAYNDTDSLLSAMNTFFKLMPKFAERYPSNIAQFTGPDFQGWKFGLELIVIVISSNKNTELLKLQQTVAAYKAMSAPKPPSPKMPEPPLAPLLPDNPGDFQPPYPVRAKGVMLSQISMERHQTYHLWPLIWDDNYSKIGDNPNQVPINISLKIRKKEKFTKDQVTDAHKRSPTWRNYPPGHR